MKKTLYIGLLFSFFLSGCESKLDSPNDQKIFFEAFESVENCKSHVRFVDPAKSYATYTIKPRRDCTGREIANFEVLREKTLENINRASIVDWVCVVTNESNINYASKAYNIPAINIFRCDDINSPKEAGWGVGYNLIFADEVKFYEGDIVKFSGTAYLPNTRLAGLGEFGIDINKLNTINLKSGESQQGYNKINSRKQINSPKELKIADIGKEIDLNNGEYLLKYGENEFVVFNHGRGAFEGDSFYGVCKSSDIAANIPAKYKSPKFNSVVNQDSIVYFDCMEIIK